MAESEMKRQRMQFVFVPPCHILDSRLNLLSGLSPVVMRTELLTVPRTLDLMDQVMHVIIKVEIALAAVGMLRVFLLVLDHSCF
jgi:hypothetical protein